jgi:DNA recombination protein RmuC
MTELAPLAAALAGAGLALALALVLLPGRVAAAVRSALADRLEALERGEERLGRGLREELRALSDSNERRLEALRGNVDARLERLQEECAMKLDLMRLTVEE